MRTARVLGATALALALVLSAAGAAPAAPGAEPQRRLDVASDGGGLIRSTDGHVDCGSRCSRAYRSGALVTLTATPGRNFSFERWSSGCVGTVATCIVAVERAMTVRAVFVRLPAQLGVNVGGAGVIASSPLGIVCSSVVASCLSSFGQGETVRLIAAPAPGSEFARWGGACAAAPIGLCELVLAPENRVTATFRRAEPEAGEQTLTIRSAFTPVISSPPGIACPGACSASFASGTVVTLTGTPQTAWGGACAGVAEPCTVVVDGPTEVIASAVLSSRFPGFPGFGINISVSGPGRVEARSGIRCGRRTGHTRDCKRFFAEGSKVVLRAVPEKRARLLRWGSFCSGRARTCPLRVTAPKSVLAVFGRR